MNDEPPPYRTIVFDCDSTLSSIEGIDELAREHKDEIAALTERAMKGELPLEAVYGKRLALVRPSRSEIERVGALYVSRALPHARELVAALKRLKKRVCIVSGGLRPAVQALADTLSIPASDVFAVDVTFDSRGDYAAFDERSPLARAGGKIEVLDAIRRATSGPACLVGDGVTDLEAGVRADRFVAYGGVARREPVFARARVTCTSPDLAALAPLLFSESEMDVLSEHPEHGALIRAARAIS